LFKPTAIRLITAMYFAALGLLPVALGFWAYYPLLVEHYPPVYFAYSSVLLFPADLLTITLLAADAGLRLLTGRPLAPRPAPPTTALLLLAAWAAASAAWSPEPRLSLYHGLHLGLTASMALFLADRPEAWAALATGSLGGIGLQVLVAAGEVLLQTTAFLDPLGLEWPGRFDPSVSGAAVVELPDGSRWLRAYGTFPHPNLLGIYLVALAAGPMAWTLEGGGRRTWGIIGVGLAAVGLGLTFSRAAWLAFLIVLGWVLGAGPPAPGRGLLAATAAMGLLAAVLPFGQVLGVRLGIQGPLETRSVLERGWLVAQAADLIRTHGPLGLGAGTFPLALRDRLPPGYRAEPAHNVGVLLLAELGPLGLGLGLAAGLGVLRGLRRTAGADGLALSGALLGLVVLAMLDHPLWTAAPGHLLVALVLGAWLGQIRKG